MPPSPALVKMRRVRTSHCKQCGTPVFTALTPSGRVELFDVQTSATGSYAIKKDVGDLVAMRDATSPGARFERHQMSCRGLTVGGEAYR